MKIFLSAVFLFCLTIASVLGQDSAATEASVLVIPYMPAMHLSDADIDIAQGSEMDIAQMRAALRKGIIRDLNKNFADIYDVKAMKSDFVKDDNDDVEALYHSVMFERDSVYPLKFPKRFAIKDTVVEKKKPTKIKPETQYINAAIADQMLVSDLSKKYNADYIIFLNEIDIKTHAEDCINLALKIYRRDLKIHYSIFNKEGKQVYGDVAVSHFDSNSNDVNEIMKKNFPAISNYILASLARVEQ